MNSRNHSTWQKALLLFCIIAMPVMGRAQCFSSWQYSMKIFINNANAYELDSFQVPLYINTSDLVTAGHMNVDGSDIRFVTSPNCCISLPYHIDSGMNSTATKIWVKVPYVATSGNDTITMLYGNAGAAAASNPVTTYDLWEGFDSLAGRFTQACDDGTGTSSFTVAGGLGTFSWEHDAIWTSDSTFGLNHTYTADAMVTASSGDWPELNWSKASSTYAYTLLFAGFTAPGTPGGSLYIGPTLDEGLGFCNEVYLYDYQQSTDDGTGLWSFTWVNSGVQQGSYRSLGTFTYNDATWAKDEPLKLCLGSIDQGVGSYTMDWVRVRKYADAMPTATYDAEAAHYDTINYATPLCKSPTGTATATNNGPVDGTYSMAPAGTINATTGSIDLNATAAGTYIVTYTAPSLVDTCNYVAVTTVTINAAVIPTVTASGLTLTASGTYATYQWYRNGTLVAGATTNPYTATQSGSYYVVVTDANGCSAQSAAFPLIPFSVANVSAIDNVSVYPNPNNGTFTIDGTAKADDNKAMIEVTDIAGKVLMTTTTKIVNNTIHQEIQLNGKIPAGVYMLRITAGTEKKTVRLNVQ